LKSNVLLESVVPVRGVASRVATPHAQRVCLANGDGSQAARAALRVL